MTRVKKAAGRVAAADPAELAEQLRCACRKASALIQELAALAKACARAAAGRPKGRPAKFHKAEQQAVLKLRGRDVKRSAKPAGHGQCPLCSSEQMLCKHHLYPRGWCKAHGSSKEQRRKIVRLCQQCHDVVHSMLSHEQLAASYNTAAALCAHEPLVKACEQRKARTAKKRGRPSLEQSSGRGKRRRLPSLQEELASLQDEDAEPGAALLELQSAAATKLSRLSSTGCAEARQASADELAGSSQQSDPGTHPRTVTQVLGLCRSRGSERLPAQRLRSPAVMKSPAAHQTQTKQRRAPVVSARLALLLQVRSHCLWPHCLQFLRHD